MYCLRKQSLVDLRRVCNGSLGPTVGDRRGRRDIIDRIWLVCVLCPFSFDGLLPPRSLFSPVFRKDYHCTSYLRTLICSHFLFGTITHEIEHFGSPVNNVISYVLRVLYVRYMRTNFLMGPPAGIFIVRTPLPFFFLFIRCMVVPVHVLPDGSPSTRDIYCSNSFAVLLSIYLFDAW